MFASFRKHRRATMVVWWIIILIVIVSFVVFFAPNINMDRVGQVQLGTIKGKPITQEQFDSAENQVKLMFRFRYRDEADRMYRQMQSQVERETYNRIILAEKMRELDVHIGPDASAEWIRQHFGDPATRRINVDQLKSALAPFGLQDLEALARYELGRDHLASVYGIGGDLVPPKEAEAAFRLENDDLLTEVALFPASNYMAKVELSAEQVSRYFTNNAATYRIPERVQVSYIKFSPTNFPTELAETLSKLTNVSTQVDAYYQKQGSNFFKDPQGMVMAPEAAKEKILQDFRNNVAQQLAREKATQFASALYDHHEKFPTATNLFEMIAATNNYRVETSEAFTERDGPTNMKVPAAFAQAAFSLTAEQPYTAESIDSEEGSYMLNLRRRVPSEMPVWEQVRERVTADYRREEAEQLAEQAGQKFHAAATNALAQGKAFSAVAADEKVTHVALPPISLGASSAPLDPRVNLQQVQGMASRLTPGKISPFVRTQDGGMVLFLREQKPVDAEKMRAELPKFTETLRQQRQNLAFSDWYKKLEQQMQLVVPAATRQR